MKRVAVISGLAGLLIPVNEQQRGLYFSAEFQQCQSQRYREILSHLTLFLKERRLFSFIGLILNIQLALLPLLPMHRGFGSQSLVLSILSQ